jgi:hypothetical protein
MKLVDSRETQAKTDNIFPQNFYVAKIIAPIIHSGEEDIETFAHFMATIYDHLNAEENPLHNTLLDTISEMLTNLYRETHHCEASFRKWKSRLKA